MLDEDASITFDRSTTKVSIFDGSEEIGSIEKIVSTEQARNERRRSLDDAGEI